MFLARRRPPGRSGGDTPPEQPPTGWRYGLLAHDRGRLAVRAEVHVDDLRLGDGHPLVAVAEGLDDDPCRDRRGADAHRLRPEADQVSDVDRLMEDDLVHRHGDHEMAALPARLDRSRLV